jgi:protein gp37
MIMKIENNIGWCDETTNAVTGCDKVSPGCRNCYAATGTRARVLRSQGIETWGPKGVRHPVAQFAEKIRRLNKLCMCDVCGAGSKFFNLGLEHADCPGASSTTQSGVAAAALPPQSKGRFRRIRLFADSNSDWLDRKWAVETRANALKEIHDAPNVDFLMLTKRAEDFEELMIEAALYWHTAHSSMEATEMRFWLDAWRTGDAPSNVWLGVSVENQALADLRIPQLLAIPAAVRFLSCEPLLEPIRFTAGRPFHIYEHKGKPCCLNSPGFHAYSYVQMKNGGIDWVIVGGESGADRRDCGVGAIVSVAEQCAAAGVPVYVKQDCAFKSGEQGRIPQEVWKLKQFPGVLTAENAKSAENFTDEHGCFATETQRRRE